MRPTDLYDKLPASAQSVATTAVGAWVNARRYRKPFPQMLEAARQRLSWDESRVIEFRNARLRTIAELSASVPHYRHLYGELGITWQDVATPEGLAALPLLHKSEVQANVADFRPPGEVGATFISHTSGTTGAGLRFPLTWEGHREQWAIWWRYRERFGITRRTWCGYFGGRSVVPVHQSSPPFWRINQAERQILFSGYHMGPRTLDAYVDELRRRQPSWLHGYPSLLALVAAHLLERGQNLGYEIAAITTGAESLLPVQRQQITQAFGVAPHQHYGAAEAVANLSECEAGRLHIDEDFSLVEFVPLGDGSNELIGSGFSNRALILLRYASGDTAPDPDPASCPCGRWGRSVSDVDGRIEDYLDLPDGRRIGRLDHVFKDLTTIKEAQVQQSADGALRILVAAQPGWGEADEAHLRAELTQRIGPLPVRIELVTAVPRTGAGKLRLVMKV